MLVADIRYADLTAPIAVIDGGVSFGASSVRPLSHRMLRIIVAESDGLVAIFVSERFSDDPNGLSHIRLPADAVLLDRVRQWESHILDWSTLTIDRRRRQLRYRASTICSAPVYAWTDGDRAAFDWDYRRLLDGIDAPIDRAPALAHVAGIAGYSPHTMVSGLYRSTAGAVLAVDARGIRARLPEPTEIEGPQQLAEGCMAGNMVFKAIKSLLAVRPLQVDRTAVEISGGMDSALAGLAAAEVLGPGVLSAGAQFRGAMGEAQRERRALLRRLGGFDDLELPAHRFAPFAPGSPRRVRFGVWPQDENYPEIFETIFAALSRSGIDTLISGFGGDELYPTYVGEQTAAEPRERPPHPYLTDMGRRLAANGARTYPQGALQETCWQAAAGRSQRLLRHGLWPVYPYHSPDLARFVSRLPWEYRHNRNLLRRALAEKTGSGVFDDGYVKESFGEVAVQGMMQNKDYLIEIVRQSDFARAGLIDGNRVVQALSGDIFALPVNETEALYGVLTTCCFFQDAAGNQPPR